MHQIATGLWQLSGVPRNMINVYLMEDVLIDAGTRWAAGRILRQLRGRKLSMVALTHCHPDHQGVAKQICERWGIPLACHEAEVAAVEGRAAMQPNNRIMRLGHRLWSGPAHPVGRILHEGDEVTGFRVIHAPGHTPGHIVFFREADRVLVAGDVLANINFLTGKPGLRQPPKFFSADPAQNRQSIRLVAALQPAVVCFGHGPPLRDSALLERYASQAALR
jgi:hydroxyacylglutathione hydrolase